MKRIFALLLVLLVGWVSLTVSRVYADLLVIENSSLGDNILRYDETTGAFIDVFIPVGRGGLVTPEDMVFGPDGNLYVSDQANKNVLRFDATGTFIDEFVSPGQFLKDLTFGPDGNLYATEDVNSVVVRYDGTTGNFLGNFTSGSPVPNPQDLVFGPDGNLYVTSRWFDNVQRYHGTTGAFLGTFVSSGSGGLDEPIGLVFGPDGNLYVSSNATDNILRYDGTTGALIGTGIFASGDGLNGPFGLTFGPDGNLYIANRSGIDNVLRYDGTTGAFIDVFVPFVSVSEGGLQASPTFLTFTPELAPIPEPTTMALLGIGLVGLGGRYLRRRKLKRQ